MSTPKILVTRRWPQETLDRVATLGDVTFRDPDTTMSHDEFLAAATEYDVIMPTVSDKIPAAFYPAAKGKVKILASYGVGYNHIDLDAARANDIAVTNTPDVLTDCTADLAMGLLLAAVALVPLELLSAAAWMEAELGANAGLPIDPRPAA